MNGSAPRMPYAFDMLLTKNDPRMMAPKDISKNPIDF